MNYNVILSSDLTGSWPNSRKNFTNSLIVLYDVLRINLSKMFDERLFQVMENNTEHIASTSSYDNHLNYIYIVSPVLNNAKTNKCYLLF